MYLLPHLLWHAHCKKVRHLGWAGLEQQQAKSLF